MYGSRRVPNGDLLFCTKQSALAVLKLGWWMPLFEKNKFITLAPCAEIKVVQKLISFGKASQHCQPYYAKYVRSASAILWQRSKELQETELFPPDTV